MARRLSLCPLQHHQDFITTIVTQAFQTKQELAAAGESFGECIAIDLAQVLRLAQADGQDVDADSQLWTRFSAAFSRQLLLFISFGLALMHTELSFAAPLEVADDDFDLDEESSPLTEGPPGTEEKKEPIENPKPQGVQQPYLYRSSESEYLTASGVHAMATRAGHFNVTLPKLYQFLAEVRNLLHCIAIARGVHDDACGLVPPPQLHEELRPLCIDLRLMDPVFFSLWQQEFSTNLCSSEALLRWKWLVSISGIYCRLEADDLITGSLPSTSEWKEAAPIWPWETPRPQSSQLFSPEQPTKRQRIESQEAKKPSPQRAGTGVPAKDKDKGRPGMPKLNQSMMFQRARRRKPVPSASTKSRPSESSQRSSSPGAKPVGASALSKDSSSWQLVKTEEFRQARLSTLIAMSRSRHKCCQSFIERFFGALENLHHQTTSSLLNIVRITCFLQEAAMDGPMTRWIDTRPTHLLYSIATESLWSHEYRENAEVLSFLAALLPPRSWKATTLKVVSSLASVCRNRAAFAPEWFAFLHSTVRSLWEVALLQLSVLAIVENASHENAKQRIRVEPSSMSISNLLRVQHGCFGGRLRSEQVRLVFSQIGKEFRSSTRESSNFLDWLHASSKSDAVDLERKAVETLIPHLGPCASLLFGVFTGHVLACCLHTPQDALASIWSTVAELPSGSDSCVAAAAIAAVLGGASWSPGVCSPLTVKDGTATQKNLAPSAISLKNLASNMIFTWLRTIGTGPTEVPVDVVLQVFSNLMLCLEGTQLPSILRGRLSGPSIRSNTILFQLPVYMVNGTFPTTEASIQSLQQDTASKGAFPWLSSLVLLDHSAVKCLPSSVLSTLLYNSVSASTMEPSQVLRLVERELQRRLQHLSESFGSEEATQGGNGQSSVKATSTLFQDELCHAFFLLTQWGMVAEAEGEGGKHDEGEVEIRGRQRRRYRQSLDTIIDGLEAWMHQQRSRNIAWHDASAAICDEFIAQRRLFITFNAKALLALVAFAAAAQNPLVEEGRNTLAKEIHRALGSLQQAQDGSDGTARTSLETSAGATLLWHKKLEAEKVVQATQDEANRETSAGTLLWWCTVADALTGSGAQSGGDHCMFTQLHQIMAKEVPDSTLHSLQLLSNGFVRLLMSHEDTRSSETWSKRLQFTVAWLQNQVRASRSAAGFLFGASIACALVQSWHSLTANERIAESADHCFVKLLDLMALATEKATAAGIDTSSSLSVAFQHLLRKAVKAAEAPAGDTSTLFQQSQAVARAWKSWPEERNARLQMRSRFQSITPSGVRSPYHAEVQSWEKKEETTMAPLRGSRKFEDLELWSNASTWLHGDSQKLSGPLLAHFQTADVHCFVAALSYFNKAESTRNGYTGVLSGARWLRSAESLPFPQFTPKHTGTGNRPGFEYPEVVDWHAAVQALQHGVQDGISSRLGRDIAPPKRAAVLAHLLQAALKAFQLEVYPCACKLTLAAVVLSYAGREDRHRFGAFEALVAVCCSLEEAKTALSEGDVESAAADMLVSIAMCLPLAHRIEAIHTMMDLLRNSSTGTARQGISTQEEGETVLAAMRYTTLFVALDLEWRALSGHQSADPRGVPVDALILCLNQPEISLPPFLRVLVRPPPRPASQTEEERPLSTLAALVAKGELRSFLAYRCHALKELLKVAVQDSAVENLVRGIKHTLWPVFGLSVFSEDSSSPLQITLTASSEEILAVQKVSAGHT